MIEILILGLSYRKYISGMKRVVVQFVLSNLRNHPIKFYNNITAQSEKFVSIIVPTPTYIQTLCINIIIIKINNLQLNRNYK